MDYHLHVLTEYGEDVVCPAHLAQGLTVSLDAPIDHVNEGSDTCGRCFVCEGCEPGTARPVANKLGQVDTGSIRVREGFPMDNSIDAEYEFGKCDTTEQLTSRVGTHNAARLLVLRSRLQDRAMFAVYPGDDNIVLPRSAELWRRMQP